MVKKYKSKLFLLFFAFSALVLAWGVWTNYRPSIILASCSDIAYKSSSISKRYSILDDTENKYDVYLEGCLHDAGLTQ
jgi:hypothetical protein